MSQRETHQFLDLYRMHRYEHQHTFYRNASQQFERAQTQAIGLSIGLMFLSALAAGMASFTPASLQWLRLICLLLAAICPVLSTTLAAYSTLYGFEQQEKLYHDTLDALFEIRAREPDVRGGLSDTELDRQVDDYVQEVEEIFKREQGQWGQLAKRMKPPDA